MQIALQSYPEIHRTQDVSADQSRVKHLPVAGKTARAWIEYTTAANLRRKKVFVERHISALSADLALASAILSKRAGEIVNFACALPTDCDREEAATRISTFIESLYPPSSSLLSGRSLHSGLADILANHVTANRVAWKLALTTIVLVVLAATLIAK
jgi:hypothetical protein